MARRLNHRQIEAFRAAVELGSATAAAEVLYVSQPAVTRLIGDLERTVGFELFERRRRGLQPTEDGLLLYEEVERSFRGLDRIAEVADAIQSRRTGHIRVIAIPVYADSFASRAVGRFLAAHPGITVELETAGERLLVDRIVSEKHDVGLSTLSFREKGLDARVLGSHEAVCIAPRGHPIASDEIVSMDSIAAQPFIALPVGNPFRLAVDRHASEAGAQLNIAAEVRTQPAICNIVASGAGVSIVDPVVAEDFGGTGLAVMPFRPSLSWNVAVLTPTRKAPSQATQSLIASLEEELAHAGDASDRSVRTG